MEEGISVEAHAYQHTTGDTVPHTQSVNPRPFEDSEQFVHDSDELDKPPSPLSLQQGGGVGFLQSPPFGVDNLPISGSEGAAAESSPKDHTLADISDDYSEMDEPAQATIPLATTVLVTGAEMEAETLPTRQTIVSANRTNEVTNAQTKESNGIEPSLFGDGPTVPPATTPSSRPVRKSVQELYGQPSWWGDGEDNYSYPHTSMLSPKRDSHSSPKKTAQELTPDPCTEPTSASVDQSERPRAESFVIAFGSSKAAGDKPSSTSGSLSQCIPDRLRRGFDERERERQQEKLRRQAANESVKAPAPKLTRGHSLTTKRASNTPTTNGAATRGLSSTRGSRTTSNTLKNDPRTIKSAGPTRVAASATPTTTKPAARPAARNFVPRCAPNMAELTAAARRAMAASSSPASPISKKPGSRTPVSVTPSTTSTPVTKWKSNTGDTPRSGQTIRGSRKASECATEPSSLSAARSFARRGSGPPTSSVPLRSTVPQSQSRPSLQSAPLVKAPQTIKRGLTMASAPQPATAAAPKSSVRAPLKGGPATRTGSGNTRNFMSATASSGAKRVTLNEAANNRHSQSPTAVPNSAKKPVTSTQLRRPPTSLTHGTTSNGGSAPFNRAPSRRQTLPKASELTALVMATIDSYEDPKEYLLYRMLQGTDLTDAAPKTDDVFKSFRSRSPSLSKPRISVVKIDPISTESNPDSKVVKVVEVSNQVQQRAVPVTTDHLEVIEQQPSASTPTGQILTCNHRSPNENASSADLKATQPLASQQSPVQQRRHFKTAMVDYLPVSTTDTLSCSMLVSTSITSLAPSCTGTYILDANETLVGKGLLGHLPTDVSAQVGSLPRLPSITEPDSLTPRGSPVEMFDVGRSQTPEPDYQKVSTASSVQRSWAQPNKSADPATSARIQDQVNKSPVTGVKCNPALRQFFSTLGKPSGNLDTYDSLDNIPGRYPNTASTSSWVETCKDDMELDRTEAPQLSCSDTLDGGILVSASVTSLAPSCAATYVLDVDETLAAQGILPVVVQSREDLLSPTERRKLFTRSRSDDCTTTPKASPAKNGHDGLWDVLEAEECTDDFSISHASNAQQAMCQWRRNSSPGETSDSKTNHQDADAFRLLPQPSRPQLPGEHNSSLSDLEARLQRMSDTAVSLEHDATEPSSWHQQHSNIVTCRSTRPPITYSMSVGGTQSNVDDLAPNSVPPVPKDNAVFRQASLNTTSLRSGHVPIALKRPERSPSTSGSSASTSFSGRSGTNRRTSQEMLREYLVPDTANTPLVKPECSPSAYIPLTDIHDCYRALQDSVNFLIQSHSGPLPLGDMEPTSEHCNEYGSLPNPTRQSGGHLSGPHFTQQPLLVAHPPMQRLSSAAVWPSEISCLGDESHKLLSKRHRLDGRQRSTASLDSALEKYDDIVTEPVQSGLNYHRSVITAIQRHSFLSEKTSDRRTVPVDTNVRMAGTINASKISPASSLGKSDVQEVIHLGSSLTPYRAVNVRTVTSRTGSSSVPEPASPTNSSSLQSVTKDAWIHDHGERTVPFPLSNETYTRPCMEQSSLNRVRTVSDDRNLVHDVLIPTQTILSRTTPNDRLPTNEASVVPQEIDSRTFTRRKNAAKPPPHVSAVDSEAYKAWITSISAISHGLETLTKTSLLRSQSGKEYAATGYPAPLGNNYVLEQVNSELPDSTTGPTLSEPVRSAFVTPVPQRSVNRAPGVQTLSISHASSSSHLDHTAGSLDQTYKTELDTSETSGIPASPRTDLGDSNESAVYTLMVDSIRQLSFKLRECSDRLVRQVSSQQSNIAEQARVNKQDSRTSSTDSVPTSTKYALNDALENMHTINEQLKIVDRLLFSTQQINRSRSGDSYCQQTSLPKRDRFQFVPIDQDRHVSSGQTIRSAAYTHPTTSVPANTTGASDKLLALSSSAPKPAETSTKWTQIRHPDATVQQVQYIPACSGAPNTLVDEEDEEYY